MIGNASDLPPPEHTPGDNAVHGDSNNTAAQSPGADFAAAHRTRVYRQLIKREFWEHKGGFFWAPLAMAAVVAVLTILASITGTMKVGGYVGDVPRDLVRDGFEFNGKTGLDAAAEAFGMAGDASLISGLVMTSIVLAFVVFFYALGSLYDDRKDRSVLFWKSMPISDTQMVLSKVAWALILAPALSIIVGLALGIALWLISAATASLNDIPGASGLLTRSHPMRLLIGAVLQLPIYALWALPTVGWLLLCSAWARSKPFLWAVLIPILGAVLLSWLDGLPGIDIPHVKVWYMLVVRGLLSTVPGIFLINDKFKNESAELGVWEGLAHVFSADDIWQAFTSVDLWIGAIIGAAMILAAIRLRRWRDEG